MLDFQKNSAITFRCSSITIIATPALAGAWFEVDLKGRVTQHGRQTTPLFGSIQLSLPGKNVVWQAFGLKQAYVSEPFHQEYDGSLVFNGFVSYAQLEAFEKERNGKDFSVEVNVSLRVLDMEGMFENWHINHGLWRMNAQDWVSKLANCGYKKYLFHELVFPTNSAASTDSVYSNLCKARDHFDAGLYRECVADLRMAEEKLRNRRGDKDAIVDAVQSSQRKESREAMPLDERMLTLRNGVYSALHTAPHGDEPDSAFTREAAKALLVIFSALVEFFPEPEEPL